MTMHVCRKCGNVVGSHHEVLSVLLSGSIQYTIQYTIIHIDTEASTYCAPHSIGNVELDTCLDLIHVSRLEPRVVRGSRWVETAPGTPDPQQLEVGGDQSVSRPQSSCTHHSNIFHSIFKYFSHLVVM